MRGLGGMVVTVALGLAACSDEPKAAGGHPTAAVSIAPAAGGGAHALTVERAVTPAEQEKGLMYRTDLGRDGAMLFYPYPAEGGPPRVATFWMKNTPTPLDIVFIRPDGTIARIAENATPNSEAMISSGEPVGAVLELVGGRAAELGIAEGDKVALPGK